MVHFTCLLTRETRDDDEIYTRAGVNAFDTNRETANFGFNGSYSGSNATPTSFKLNGVTCSS
jgi:hypothetical protein